MRIGDGIAAWAQRRSGARAVVVAGGPSLSYGELLALVDAEAQAMQHRPAGTPVVVVASAPLAYLIRFLGVLRAGLVAACPQPGADAAAVQLPPGLTLPSEIFYMGFTSGTTGAPKALLRTHRSWIESFGLMTELFGAPERVIVPGSLSYSAALIAALHALECGGTLWLLAGAPEGRLAEHLEQAQATSAFLVPARLRAILGPGRRSSLRPLTVTTAGAKLDAPTRQGVEALFPRWRLFEYYGSAEMGFVTCLDPAAGQRWPDSVGRLCPGVECELRGAAGGPVPSGEAGIIHVRSPYQFAGYAGTDGISSGDWVTVGDWGRFNAEGFLYLLGRGHDQLNIGGAKVFAPQVEAALLTHPDVQEVAVIGVSDRLRGEVAGAVVVVRPGARLVPAQLRRWCAQRLPGPAVPRRLVFAPGIPRNTAGKTDRQALLALLRRC